MKKVFITLLVLFSVGFVGFAEPTNGRKLTEEELVPTFDLSMTIKSEADFDTVVWFTEWENGKDGKLVAAWEYIIPAKKTTILFLNEKATQKAEEWAENHKDIIAKNPWTVVGMNGGYVLLSDGSKENTVELGSAAAPANININNSNTVRNVNKNDTNVAIVKHSLI